MPQFVFDNSGAVQKIFTGNRKCPKTVVIQLVIGPSGANPFISPSQQDLQNASSFAVGGLNALTAGFGIQDFSGLIDQVILPDVRVDLWARCSPFNNLLQGPAVLAVEAF